MERRWNWWNIYTQSLQKQMKPNKEDKLTIRENIVLKLVIFLIQMIHPWEYSHQYQKFWDEIKDLTK